MLTEDVKVREYLKRKLARASVDRVLIERPAKNARVTVYSTPGRGHRQEGRYRTTAHRSPAHHGRARPCVHRGNPEAGNRRPADRRSIAQQLEKRIMFRRAMKRAMQNAMRLGAQGIKVMSAGRLNGAKLPVANGIAKVVFRCIRCAPISTTELPRR